MLNVKYLLMCFLGKKGGVVPSLQRAQVSGSQVSGDKRRGEVLSFK